MADTWTPISGYTPQDYTDTAVFEVDPDTKKIALITGQPLVAGEENSQYIKFLMPRYWDGIDIKDKAFYIEYALAGTYYGKTAAVNAEYTTEQIRFGWVVPKEACCIAGTLLFILRTESEDYVLKTQIAEHPVYKSVNVEDVIPEPTKEAWYIEFEARVETAISEADSAISEAQTAQIAAEIAAQNAQTAEANAEAAAQTAQEYADVIGTPDATLAIAGKAADAKATGDAINELKSELSGCQIINSIGEMTTVTSDKVLVLHNDSPWGNNGPCWFEYLEYATEGGYVRQDGGKMYPMLDQGPLIASTPPVETMMSLISSYVENDSLVYGTDETLFESETSNKIDCSAFVSAILHGIAYSFSKYTGSSVNRRTEKISSYSPTPLSSLNPPLQRLRTRYMAQYFAEQGWLHKMPSYLNMRDVLQFGDILFSWDGTEVAEKRFLKIGHVSIVLAVLDSTQIVVAQCGGYPSDPAKPPVVTKQDNSRTVGKISTIDLNDENINTYFTAFARIPYTAQIDASCVGNKLKPVFIPNTYIDESRRGVESISGICATSYGYIKVNPGSTLTFTGSSAHRGYDLIAMVVEYDKNLQCIEKTVFTSTPKTLSANTRYIKLCFAHSTSGDRPPMLMEDIEQFEATIS